MVPLLRPHALLSPNKLKKRLAYDLWRIACCARSGDATKLWERAAACTNWERGLAQDGSRTTKKDGRKMQEEKAVKFPPGSIIVTADTLRHICRPLAYSLTPSNYLSRSVERSVRKRRNLVRRMDPRGRQKKIITEIVNYFNSNLPATRGSSPGLKGYVRPNKTYIFAKHLREPVRICR